MPTNSWNLVSHGGITHVGAGVVVDGGLGHHGVAVRQVSEQALVDISLAKCPGESKRM